jgi:hypothetical protein
MHTGKFIRSHIYTSVWYVYYFHFLEYWQTVGEKEKETSVIAMELLVLLTQFSSALIDFSQTILYEVLQGLHLSSSHSVIHPCPNLN